MINEIGILRCWHEMDGLIDAIKMKDCKMRLTSNIIDIWLYHPETHVFIQAFEREPLYKFTGILSVLMLKGEEKKNIGDLKPACSINIWIGID